MVRTGSWTTAKSRIGTVVNRQGYVGILGDSPTAIRDLAAACVNRRLMDRYPPFGTLVRSGASDGAWRLSDDGASYEPV